MAHTCKLCPRPAAGLQQARSLHDAQVLSAARGETSTKLQKHTPTSYRTTMGVCTVQWRKAAWLRIRQKSCKALTIPPVWDMLQLFRRHPKMVVGKPCHVQRFVSFAWDVDATTTLQSHHTATCCSKDATTRRCTQPEQQPPGLPAVCSKALDHCKRFLGAMTHA